MSQSDSCAERSGPTEQILGNRAAECGCIRKSPSEITVNRGRDLYTYIGVLVPALDLTFSGMRLLVRRLTFCAAVSLALGQTPGPDEDWKRLSRAGKVTVHLKSGHRLHGTTRDWRPDGFGSKVAEA